MAEARARNTAGLATNHDRRGMVACTIEGLMPRRELASRHRKCQQAWQPLDGLTTFTLSDLKVRQMPRPSNALETTRTIPKGAPI